MNWSRVLRYFRPELPKVLLAIVLMSLGIGANLLKPWPVALVIDHIIAGKPAPAWLPATWRALPAGSLLGVAALLILLLHCAQGGLSAGQNYLSIAAGLSSLTRIRNQLFDWMLRLSLSFYQKRNQGDLIYRASWDTYSLQTIFQHGVFKFLSSFITIALMLVVMWQLSASLALITTAIFPPLLVTMYFFGQRMNARSLLAHQADSQVTSLVQQNIAGVALIQSYAREEFESARFAAQVREAQSSRLAQHGLEVRYWFVIAVLFGVGTAMITWWGSREILAQRLTVGELVIFLAYLGQLYDPLNQLSHVGATVSDANAGLHRIFEILDARDELVLDQGTRSFPELKRGGGSILLENISFGYTPGKAVLNDISLEIAVGETIGLIGPSGAGKTTLLNLLPRFYDPTSGQITIGAANLKEFRLHELRRNISCVFQESSLLPATIAENIAYGRPGAHRTEIEEAARLANAHEFIARLPHGYDTVVGEAAARLSVGEKQRINIARAFLKNAPILLLDEPTSALDAESEASIIESFGRLLANRTTIMAAHRLSTLQYATRLVVIENGVITQSGSPEELKRQGGYYTRALAQSFTAAPIL